MLAILSVISVGAAIAGFIRRDPVDLIYKAFRRSLTRSVVIGLEILVVPDIIATVTVEPSMSSLLALGLLVVIRTFLSVSLQAEVEGAWPWTAKRGSPQNS